MNRRMFVTSGLSGAAALLLATKSARGSNPSSLIPFLDSLPVPPVLRPSPQGTVITMKECWQQLHSQLPPTRLWGYNGIVPGPTIEVQSGTPVSIKWETDLPPWHLFHDAVDHKLHGASGLNTPEVRNVVHLHGIKVLPDSDGYPESWFTPGTSRVYNYPNDQPATCLWYHDHAIGITRLNVYAGLAGYYLIRDKEEAALNLPSGKYEIPLLIQDRQFNVQANGLLDGSLVYPIDTTGTQEVWIPEFFGDTVMVNGKVWPYLEVEPRKYRFRMLNGSNARFYNMKLQQSTLAGQLTGPAGPGFTQVGSDQGLLPFQVHMSTLLMAPAERFDIVIDFSAHQGKTFVLTNDANEPYPGGDPCTAGQIMQFRVTKPLAGKDTSTVPVVLGGLRNLSPGLAIRERNLELSELDRDSDGYPIIGLLDGLRWTDPVTENPKAGTTEIWNLVNTTTDAHPIHIHLVHFLILSRQAFSATAWANGKLVYTGLPKLPAANELLAPKDTVVSYPGEVVKLVMRFDLPTGTKVTPGERFRYVWHCHILEHEDNEMMRPFDVIG